jgi:hypothetical protein
MLQKLIAITALLSAGMIFGISFLESWLKFRASSLTKAVGLDVGRTVFSFFHKIQCVLLFEIIFTVIFIEFTSINWLIVATLTGIFIFQLAWLFPKLSQQVNVILAGNKISDSYAHTPYGIFEVTKFLALIVFSMRLIF